MVTVMAEKKMMTVEGLKKLEDELHERKVIIRKEIADKIKEAREQGDLSENAEYDAARDEQRDNEAKIEELENLIKNAVVISDDDIDHNVANLGSAVTLKAVSYTHLLVQFINVIKALSEFNGLFLSLIHI